MTDKNVGFFDDVIFALSNLIAAENHSKESYVETKDENWIKVAEMERKMRSKWLDRFTIRNGQNYCHSKHAMAVSMGLKEMGDRFKIEGNMEWAKECYEDAETMQRIFKLIQVDFPHDKKEVANGVLEKEASASGAKGKSLQG